MLDALIRGADVYDGLGSPPRRCDVGVRGDRIAAIGDLAKERAPHEIDARGLALAPGFINSLSWATESLLIDPTAESDVRQGVTLEVFGEGSSMGPLTAEMREELIARQGMRRFPVEWRTLGEYLSLLERRGIVPNVASFVGAATVRTHELGQANRPPSEAELARMCELVREAMREGALGLGTALIYTPGAYADTAELLALAAAAAEYGGGYITHLRSESNGIVAAVEEALAIAAATRTHAEIYHLKIAGEANWHEIDAVIARVEAARARGLDVSANVYPYTAAATGLDAAMPLWVQEGGSEAWRARLKDPANRARVIAEIARPGEGWENLYAAAGSADRVLLIGFERPALRHHAGRTLGEVARARGRSPEETIVDLVLEDDSRVIAAFFMMSEDHLKRLLALPWVSLCSDEEALAPRGAFLARHPHPRAYGAFARFLGRYVREERVTGLADAVHRLTGLPARNFRLAERGRIATGSCADLVVFDPGRMADHATYADPHRFADGVRDVLVNGAIVLRDGELTGARPGRFLRGPGAKPRHGRGFGPPRAAG